MKEWFIISDLDDFVDQARNIVYNQFGSADNQEVDDIVSEVSDIEKEELDEILSHQEAMTIAKQTIKTQRHEITKDVRYILNDDMFADFIQNLNTRMVTNLLNNLANKGLIESSYDSEINDFVFWIKEDEDNNKKTETD
jgi:hypothetical protein